MQAPTVTLATDSPLRILHIIVHTQNAAYILSKLIPDHHNVLKYNRGRTSRNKTIEVVLFLAPGGLRHADC